EEAQRRGARVVINVRYETSSIGGMGANKRPMAEVMAYGTALREPVASADPQR
ncbi:MAG: putative heavy-metal-binding, partial [Planctomycetota bacterium]